MIERQEIFEAIKSHLGSRGIADEKVVIDADLVRDLDLDSLDTMELTLSLEERFGIEIPDADLEQLASVKDAVDLIERKLSVSA